MEEQANSQKTNDTTVTEKPLASSSEHDRESSLSWIDSDSDVDVSDIASNMLGSSPTQILEAFTILDTQTSLLYGQKVIHDRDVTVMMKNIKTSIEQASQHFDLSFGDYDYPKSLPFLQMERYVVEQAGGAHFHFMSRQAMFQKLVGQVLRTEIFGADLLGRVPQVSTVTTILRHLRGS